MLRLSAGISALVFLVGASACTSKQAEREDAVEVRRIVATPRRTKLPSPHPVAKARESSAPQPTLSQTPAPKRRGHADRVRMSWYTMGTRTANGEPVQPRAHNCAGASRWNLGDSVTIRNPNNGRVVTVRINDRGGFESMGRALDCMPGVWHALGFDLGAGVVWVEVLP